MTLFQAKQVIDTFLDYKELSDWVLLNKDIASQASISYAFYKLSKLDYQKAKSLVQDKVLYNEAMSIFSTPLV